jgi:pimeloyl-ACP methyl ester carboxylesterase
MMRVSAWTWPFPFGVRLGWATAATPNPQIHQAPGRVYLLRGQAVIFSGGFGTLCDRLRRAGLWAEDLRCVGDLWVRRHLLADHAAGRLHGPVILVGHSCGGRYATYTAQQLAKHGIVIDLLICVDVAGPYAVAANVKHAVHIYRGRPRLYPARPLRPAPGSAARITNLDLDAADSPISPAWLCHLNITGSAGVQSWIVERILETVGDSEDRHQHAMPCTWERRTPIPP